MLNLLPEQQKTILRKEYGVRRLILWLCLTSSALIVSLVLLLPSYILSQVKANEVRAELESTKQVIDNELKTGDTTTDISAALRHAEDLRPFIEPVSVYGLVKIFESKPETIKISDISFLNKGDVNHPQIVVRGIAPDRESLTNFGRLVEGRSEFESVDLPVSNFVKEKDLDFLMTIKVKQK